MYCSKCGKELKDGVKFCKYCGYNLEEESDDSPLNSGVEDVSNGENAVMLGQNIKADNYQEGTVTQGIGGTNELENANVDENCKKRKRRRKGEREIEDKRQLEKYTIKEESATIAPFIDTDRIKLIKKGNMRKLKATEIVSVTIAALIMIISAIIIGVVKADNRGEEDMMTALVVISYFLFFVIFLALAFGIDRLYNLLTLNELSVRKMTVKKYGWAMRPLVLRGDTVYAVEIVGECELCDEGSRGIYHIERVGDTLIAVCGYNREHIFRIDEEALTTLDDNEV